MSQQSDSNSNPEGPSWMPEPPVAVPIDRGRHRRAQSGSSSSFHFDFPRVRIKEEPQDAEGQAETEGVAQLTISNVAGNADDQWGLLSTIEFDDEVKQECYYDYEDFDDQPSREADTGEEYSSGVEQQQREETASPEVVPLSPRPGQAAADYEVVDLEAEWEGEKWSPPIKKESAPAVDPVVKKERPSPSPGPDPAGDPVVKKERPPLSPGPDPTGDPVVKKEPTSPSRGPDPAGGEDAKRGSPPSADANVKVKEERRSEEEEEEEAGREQLFGQQEHPECGEEELAAEDEKPAVPEEDDDARPPRSTTLHPAVTSELIDKMKQHVAKFVQKVAKRNAKEHEASLRAAKALALRRPRHQERSSSSSMSSSSYMSSSSPSSPDSPRRSPPIKRHHTQDDGPMLKKLKREVVSPEPAQPRRTTDSSDSAGEGSGKRRVAHKPPKWHTAEDGDAAASTSTAYTSRDPRLKPKRPELSSGSEDMDLDLDDGACGLDVSWLKSEAGAAEAVKRGLSPGRLKAKKAGASFGPAPASVKKRRMRVQDKIGGAGEAEAEAAVEPKREPSPTWAAVPGKVKKAVAAGSAPAPASVKKRRSKLPLLPAAQHINLSPHYESRSPLYVEDDAPRKSYYSAPTDSSEGKVGLRPVSAPSWLDDVLYSICRWRPEWLTESKRVSRDKFPCLLPDMARFKSETNVLHFSSTEGYLKYFQDGLLLELWDTLQKGSRRPLINAEIEGLPHDKPLLGNRKKRTYMCHCGSNQKNPFRPGDVVIIDVDAESTEKTKPFFAYVDIVMRPKVLSGTVKLSSEVIGKEHNYKCGFKLSMCADQYADNIPKVLRITKVRNVYEEVEAFKFLSDFLIHDLSPLVLNPMYAKHADPEFGLKTGTDLSSTQKSVVQSLIQDIIHYEAPSISVVEGGPGTGKTHVVAALAQELVERKHKPNRDCYVIIAAKSNNQLDMILEKLQARNCNANSSSESKDPDAFRAVWLGNEYSLKGGERLKRISLQKLAFKHSRSIKTESLKEKRDQLLKSISKNDKRLKQFNRRNLQHPELSSETAKMKLDLILITEQIEKNSTPRQSENAAMLPILDNCDIVLTTLSCNHYRMETQDALLKRHPRKHVVLIVDDASEVTEPSVIKLMAIFGITDVVLLGDTRQHTPYVSSRWARNAGLVVSLMKRYTQALQESQCAPSNRTLTRQIRLHPDIFRGINKLFYDNIMKPATIDIKKFIFRPYIWFNCTYFSEESKKFAQEADFVEKLLDAVLKAYKLYKSEDKRKRIRVISFCKEISTRLSCRSSVAEYCEIADNISSMECDILILSVGPFLKLRKDRTICALTRARKSLFICGNFQDISPRLLPLFKDARELECLEDVASSDIQENDLIQRIVS